MEPERQFEVASGGASRGADSVNTFELLSGESEDRLLRNVSLENQSPNIGYNVLHRHGRVLEPVVDRQYLANGGRKPDWPNDADFAVCLTHDVDEVSKYSVRQFIRKSVQLAKLQEKSIDGVRLLLKRAGHSVGFCRNSWRESDPYHAYERWLETEAAIGARSTFFFMPETTTESHPTDPKYRFSDTVVFDGEECSVAEMMRAIDRRGWEVGLHPTWHAYDDPDELARQKAQIEEVLGHEIASVRQHNLHHDIRTTPHAQTQAGLRFDSTLGFNDGVGFRFGTSYPWQLYDLDADERLPLLEIPLIVQDGALLNSRNGLSLDRDVAFDYVVKLAEEIEAVGGVLTLSWHPRFVTNRSWWSLYTDLLNHLQSKDVWFASVEEIGNWWLNNGFNLIQ